MDLNVYRAAPLNPEKAKVIVGAFAAWGIEFPSLSKGRSKSNSYRVETPQSLTAEKEFEALLSTPISASNCARGSKPSGFFTFHTTSTLRLENTTSR
jgi:hypothetical protein